MRETRVSFHTFTAEEFLEKLGVNDDDVVLIEDVSIQTVKCMNGSEVINIHLELRRSTPKTSDKK